MITYFIWEINPEIIEGVEFFRWYGVCWVLGMLVGHKILLRIYKTESTPLAELDKLIPYLVIGAIIGARLGHVLFYAPSYYWNNPIEILPIRINPAFEFTGLAGLASHGGILGTLLALYLYDKKYRKGYLWLLDRIVIAGAALGGFIRIGNLMNSEIIGIPSHHPWAFIFSNVDQTPRHPTQLYEAIFYFAVSTLLYYLWSSRKYYNHNGFIFGVGITVIFIHRFLIEFLKENQVVFEENLVLNLGQILSIPLILGGVGLIAWSLKIRQPNIN